MGWGLSTEQILEEERQKMRALERDHERSAKRAARQKQDAHNKAANAIHDGDKVSGFDYARNSIHHAQTEREFLAQMQRIQKQQTTMELQRSQISSQNSYARTQQAIHRSVGGEERTKQFARVMQQGQKDTMLLDMRNDEMQATMEGASEKIHDADDTMELPAGLAMPSGQELFEQLLQENDLALAEKAPAVPEEDADSLEARIVKLRD